MEIAYKDIHEFRKEDLEDLFLSVDWSSGHFPDKLVVAMRNFQTVYSAWDGDKLLDLMKQHYHSYLRIGLIAYNTELGFYESCGFKKAENASPMFITSLWT